MAVINNAEAYPPRGDYKEMSFQEELEQILRSEFYVNEHDDCDDSCSKKWYSNEAFKRALTSITNLVDKEVIGETDDILRRKTFAETQTEIKARDNLRAEQRAKLKGVRL